MKTTVVHHSADYDGIFCREIARKFLPDAELIGWDFSDKPLPFPDKDTHYYVLDLPLDKPFGLRFEDGWIARDNPVMSKEMRQIQPLDRIDWKQWTWIDHHASSIASHHYAIHNGNIPGYRIDGVAACRLAWQWFTAPERQEGLPRLPVKEEFIARKVEEPLAVRLAGEYDIWDKRDTDAELFQHGLRSQALISDDWERLLSFNGAMLVQKLLNQGECLQYAQKHQDEFIAKNRSFDVQFEGLKFFAINAVRCNSLTFEAATRPDHDALMGFYWNGKEWNVSMYHAPHRKDLDLAAIAVKLGGGGHKGACGFKTAKLPFIP
jgi:uncharacterized protein